MNKRYAHLLVFIFVQVFSFAYADEIKNITRIQARTSDSGNEAWSQSSYLQWPNSIYFLELFDRTYQTDYASWRFDMNAGGKLLGNETIYWALRDQQYQGVTNVMSAGLQLNLTHLPGKIQSFIQVFPIKSNQELGGLDIVHYYSVPISQQFSVRGYNQYVDREGGESGLFYPWLDFIYSLNSYLDIYVRVTYLSSDDAVFGSHGEQYWLGVRFNLIDF